MSLPSHPSRGPLAPPARRAFAACLAQAVSGLPGGAAGALLIHADDAAGEAARGIGAWRFGTPGTPAHPPAHLVAMLEDGGGSGDPEAARTSAAAARAAARLLGGAHTATGSAAPPQTSLAILLLLSSADPASVADAGATLAAHWGAAEEKGLAFTLLAAPAAGHPARLADRVVRAAAASGGRGRTHPLPAATLRGLDLVPALGGTGGAFVLPARGAAAALTRAAWGLGGSAAAAATEEEEDAREDLAAAAAAATAAALVAGAATSFGLRLEPFAIGPSPAAAAVGAAVAAAAPSPLPPGAPPLQTAALIILDGRATSTAAGAGGGPGGASCGGPSTTACGTAAHGDHALDRMVGCLARDGSAVAVGDGARRPPSSLTPASVPGDENDASHPSLPLPIDDGGAWGDALAARKAGDAGLLLRKWLREAARAAGVPVPPRGRAGAAPASELGALAAALAAGGPASRLASRRARALGAGAAAAGTGLEASLWDAAREGEAGLEAAAEEGGLDALGAAAASALARAAASGADDGPDDPHTAAAPLRAALLLAAGAAARAADIADADAGAGGGGGGLASPTRRAAAAADGPPSAPPDALPDAVSRPMRAALADALLTARPAVLTGLGWVPPGLVARLGAEAEARAAQAAPAASAPSFEAAALRLEVDDAVAPVMDALASVAAARRFLPPALRAGGSGGQGGGGSGGGGLHSAPPTSSTPPPRPVAELAARLLARRPLPGAAACATSLRGLIAGRLGRLAGAVRGGGGEGRQAAPTRGPDPAGPDTAVLFLLGGLCAADARAVAAAAADAAVGGGEGANDAASARPPPRVLVGGTEVLGPGDVYGRLFL